MFPKSYFPSAYFGPSYFPGAGDGAVTPALWQLRIPVGSAAIWAVRGTSTTAWVKRGNVLTDWQKRTHDTVYVFPGRGIWMDQILFNHFGFMFWSPRHPGGGIDSTLWQKRVPIGNSWNVRN